MKTSVLLFIFATSLMINAGFAQSKTQEHLDYIERYKDIAVREMVRAGIPASIKLAQAILESEAGKSDLARRANNHFGIKCNPEWDGKTFYKKDDDYDDRGRLIESCFRVYKDPESSFIAHSEFLRDPKKIERYGWLFSLDPADYKRWAKGLRSSGYATAVDYDKKLISLIERYELYKYDALSLENGEVIAADEDPNTNTSTGYMVNNDVKYVLAMDNEPVEEIARRTFTSVTTLLNYNENLRSSDQRIPKDTKIYLQPKRSSYRGKQTWHYVKQGETMQDISNQYAIKLSSLYERNQMLEGTQPAPNERIKLRGGRVSESPKTIGDLTMNHPQEPLFLFVDEPEEAPVAEVTIKPQHVEAPTTELQKPVKPSTEVVIGGNTTKPQQQPAAPIPPVSSNSQTGGSVASDAVPATTGSEPTEPRPDTGFEDDFFDGSDSLEKPENDAIYHTVVKGDTLWNIAQRYGTTVVALKKLNNLNSDGIQLGMKLQVK